MPVSTHLQPLLSALKGLLPALRVLWDVHLIMYCLANTSSKLAFFKVCLNLLPHQPLPLRVVQSSHSPRAVCTLSQIGTCLSASCWLQVVDYL